MMRDCENADMRDRLPDLVHDRLPATLRAELHAHLNQCADCRAELALLERVRAAATAVSVDAGRIVAALPAYRAPSVWRRATQSRALRIAAVIVLVIGGSMLVSDDVPQTAEEPGAAPVARVATTPDTPVTRGATSQVPVRPRQATPPAELAVGETFDDLTDTELQALLKAMESMEARTSTETEVVIPAVSRGGA
jgi:hypothetical protein